MSFFDKINPVNKIKEKIGQEIGNKIGEGIGREIKEFQEHFEALKTEVTSAFNREHDLIGRVLKCHLVLETYIDKALDHLNKDQLALDKISLRFFQKIELLETKIDEHKTYFTGIKKLNTIRNKFAHNLKAAVTVEDVKEMKTIVEMYRRKRMTNPVEIIEDFTLIACSLLQNTKSDKYAGLSQLYPAFAKILEGNPEILEEMLKEAEKSEEELKKVQ